MRTSGTPAPTIDRPNSRRRLKPRRMRSPRNMPAASPPKTAANVIPQPALPPSSVFLMYEGPRPTTTPPAEKAPIMPMMIPRTTLVRPMYFQPSQMVLATEGAEMCSLSCRLGISCRR